MTNFRIKVENVVSFTSLGNPIPLERVIGKVENAEYDPKRFPGLVYRIKEPKAVSLLFSSGKIVCTGAKSIEDSKTVIKKVVDNTRKVGIQLPKKYDIRIENIVASSKIDAKLNLEEIAFAMENAEYDPERFPGLVYRLSYPKAVLLLFRTGKIVCTGSQKTEDIHEALKKLRENLKSIGIQATPV